MKKLSLMSLLLMSACAVGPDYTRPTAEIPQSYKEAAPVVAVQGKPVEEETSADNDADESTDDADDVAEQKETPAEKPQELAVKTQTAEPHVEQAAATSITPVNSAVRGPQFGTVVASTYAPKAVATTNASNEKPAADAPENAGQLEKAEPKEDAPRGGWWEVFNDKALNALEEQVVKRNQSVQAAEAAYRQANAIVAQYRASYFPTVTGDVSTTRSVSANSSAYTVSSKVRNNYSASLNASWVPDFWGKIRRQMEEGNAQAEESAANLALATLSAQTELATNYINLRIADEQKRLLEKTVAAYKRSLEITTNQYKAGIAANADVLQAKVQLESAQAQLADVGVQRAQYEHAIAVLVSKAPADFTLPAVDSVPELPEVPVGVPSELLERRPDIAASERAVMAANAQIGVAEAAYFPNITLSASGGYDNASLARWFDLPSRFWSIGPSLAESVFDAGLRSAQTEAAIASYDQTVANYRQTVLKAFQDVEDNLTSLHVLADEGKIVDSQVADARKSQQIAMNQYKAGKVSYLNVATAQASALSAELSALTIKKQRLIAAASLIENLGGGLSVAKLESPDFIPSQTTPISILPPAIHKHDAHE